jgi:hypothetical protein
MSASRQYPRTGSKHKPSNKVLLPISWYLRSFVERRKHERRALGKNVALKRQTNIENQSDRTRETLKNNGR